MSPERAHKEALRRIQEARESGAESLDLGDLGLEKLPEELASLKWLRALSLGMMQLSVVDGEFVWTFEWERPSVLVDQIAILSELPGLEHLNLAWCKEVVDLNPLLRMTSLQSLDLSGCEKLRDLAPLSQMTAMQSLNLAGCDQIETLNALSRMRRLRTFNVAGCYKVEDLTPLSQMTALQSLDLSGCEKVTDLTPLSQMTALEFLDLSWCKGVSDLTPLSRMTAMRSLDLAHCQDVKDVVPLSRMTSLESLDLPWCKEVRDLSPLSQMMALKSLDLSHCKEVSDVAPLSRMTAMQFLSLFRCEGVTDLSPLSQMTALQSLNLHGCNKVRDLSPLSQMTSLQFLDLFRCRLDAFSPLLPLLDNLEKLILYQAEVADLPEELGGESYDENALDAVRAYYKDLEAATEADAELKVFLLGNGRVGKTQVARRLRGETFDSTVPTTHGVQLGHTTVNVPDIDKQVRINLWDFGGQDIYHGSHSLFMQGQAVFLLLWTPDHEDGESEEGGVIIRNRPLTYWLDYIRGLAGTNAPVLLIQSQCDSRDQKTNRPDASTSDLRFIEELQLSAMTGYGWKVFEAKLEEAIQEVFHRRPPVLIGRGRLAVRSHLRGMLEEDQKRAPNERCHRTLSREDFDALCETTGGVSNAGALLQFLHRNGVVFHKPDIFGDRIILDQTWALEAIYTIFDRAKTLPELCEGGRFTRASLDALVWREKGHSVEDQELFLDMMQTCGICFKLRNLGTREEPRWQYLAPELLPGWDEVKRAHLGWVPDDAATEVLIRYRFLHEGILRRFLGKIGDEAGDVPAYWKYGCRFFEEKTGSKVLITSEWGNEPAHPGEGFVRLRAWGDDPRELLERLLKKLTDIPVGQPPEVIRSWSEDDHLHHHPDADEPHIIDDSLQVGYGDPSGTKKPRRIYISYAWGDDATLEGQRRGECAEGLYRSLTKHRYPVFIDREAMPRGAWISDFMKDIGNGDCVITLISRKYLHSAFCITEIDHVHERCGRDNREFGNRTIPIVLPDAELTFEGRQALLDYWDNEYEKLSPLSVARLADHEIDLVRRAGAWKQYLAKILGAIVDRTYLSDCEQLARDDFVIVREWLDRLGFRPDNQG